MIEETYYPHHHTFRVDEELEQKINIMKKDCAYTLSFLVREALEFYYENDFLPNL